MNSFWRIFSLEHRAFLRSKTLGMLLVASAAWMLVLPRFLHGDGTIAGERELYIRYSLGGVFHLLSVALIASATGSIARERVAKRLQLTLVRPVRYTSIVLAKALAHLAIGAEVLLAAMLLLACRVELSTPCSHVFKPRIISPKEEAARMYQRFMDDPATPDEVRKADKNAVLRLLENKAIDRYDTIPTNTVTSWSFPELGKAELPLSVRMRFTDKYDSRKDLRGLFTFGEATGTVSNFTGSVLIVPLNGDRAESDTLRFRNDGACALMIRPRKDIEILTAADSFAANLFRAYLVMLSILALLIAFALLLSSGLGRPVALFVALAVLFISELVPSVVDRYPDEFNASVGDKIGLFIARSAAEVTRPVSSLNPLEKLAADECIEWGLCLRAITLNVIFLPVILSLIAGFLLPRKQDDI